MFVWLKRAIEFVFGVNSSTKGRRQRPPRWKDIYQAVPPEQSYVIFTRQHQLERPLSASVFDVYMVLYDELKGPSFFSVVELKPVRSVLYKTWATARYGGFRMWAKSPAIREYQFVDDAPAFTFDMYGIRIAL